MEARDTSGFSAAAAAAAAAPVPVPDVPQGRATTSLLRGAERMGGGYGSLVYGIRTDLQNDGNSVCINSAWF